MKYFISTLFFFLSLNLFSQISIDRSDFGVIGDTIFLERNLTGFDSLSVGPSGANVIWDFSGLTMDSVPDTLFFLDPAGFPQSSTLSPDVNLVLKDGNSLAFIEANSTGFFGHALTLDFDSFINNLLLESTPKLNLYSFPMNYGNTNFSSHSTNSITLPVKDTITVGGLTSYVDSIRIQPTIQKNDSVDAFGQLILPDSNQYDVLRQRSNVTISFSASVLIPNPLPFPPPFIWFPLPSGSIPEIENNTYNFIAKNRMYPILELSTDSAKNITGVRFQYDTASIDTVSSISSFQNEIRVYPNPTNNRIRIVNHNGRSEYTLFDHMGRIYFEGNLNETKSSIDLSSLPSGVYLLKIKDPYFKGNTQIRVLKY